MGADGLFIIPSTSKNPQSAGGIGIPDTTTKPSAIGDHLILNGSNRTEQRSGILQQTLYHYVRGACNLDQYVRGAAPFASLWHTQTVGTDNRLYTLF